jgi:hypothetical protein
VQLETNINIKKTGSKFVGSFSFNLLYHPCNTCQHFKSSSNKEVYAGGWQVSLERVFWYLRVHALFRSAYFNSSTFCDTIGLFLWLIEFWKLTFVDYSEYFKCFEECSCDCIDLLVFVNEACKETPWARHKVDTVKVQLHRLRLTQDCSWSHTLTVSKCPLNALRSVAN